MITPKRLIPRKITRTELDSVKARQAKVGKERDLHLLERCERIWDNMDDFRKERARADRFIYGDQLADLIEVNGKTMTQREYLLKTGNVALQNNQLKNKVETIVGVIVKEENEPICNAIDRKEQQYGEVITAGLKANCDKNQMGILYSLFMKEMCGGGLAVAKESYDATSGPTDRLDSWTQFVNPNQVFFDAEMTDPRFWDIKIIGQFFDKSRGEVEAMFARSKKDVAILREIYRNQSIMFNTEDMNQLTDKLDERDAVFLTPEDTTKCRVFEIWTKETKARIRLYDTNSPVPEEIIIDEDDTVYRKQVKEENLRRQRIGRESGWDDSMIPYITGDGFGADEADKNGFFIDEYWYCRFLAPDGTILWEGESPYADRSHPFTVCATPMVDGKIVGYLHDGIDLNIAMNRAMILHDWLLRAQAKGVVVVPKSIVPKDISFKEFANSWTALDEMVFIDVKPGQEKLMPQVFFSAGQNFNVSELLNTYSRQLENSTAISGAIQGKTPFAGTSGSLYAQMANNATTSIAALLKQFRNFMNEVSKKKAKNIAAFYDQERWEEIVGNIDGLFDNTNLDLGKIPDIEFDLEVKQSVETPDAKEITKQDAMAFIQLGLISFEEFLEITQVPYANKILQGRQARQAEAEAAQNGQIPQGAMADAAKANAAAMQNAEAAGVRPISASPYGVSR